ncbi:hypothetical protein I302_104303 [Kwoniella bestiolae CBS 10118]|uniref:Integral membrane protein n=1 Tax=Kwoniella bestiolae CBS 10118 TaxID=1296100 RepID=A0A1B9GAW1_9TREE|nr:hypothetical protein I302_03010 [Kwoniella bestiolae CBS 10118]OCF28159.1 hypothetical protein I302_03010 [Kwoniella bestiolae CBS 10118]
MKLRPLSQTILNLILGVTLSSEIGLIRPVGALSEYQVLQVVKGFADSYLAPENVEVARSINSTLFAEDVTGTADLSTNFDGRELSTEYLFGLFVNTAEDPDDPSPFGSPVSYNVTALLVQHNYISTSIKFQFHYPILNETVPVQIDAFMQVNEKSEIQQYDVSFRRWAWATDLLIPKLIPYMAASLNLSNETEQSAILRQYLSTKICKTAMQYCTGANEQYRNEEECMGFLNGREIGEWYRMGEDNLVCRHLHVPMLPLRPSVHCAHIGPTGGDMCIARDYQQVVMDSHFPQGWLAPKYVTPENQDEVQDIDAVSGEELDPLLEIALSPGDSHSWDPTLYATALLGYFLMFYVVSNILWFIYFRRSSIFPTLGLEHQKNIVMYTMNIIFTTIALALELVATPAFAGRYALWEVQCLRTGGVLVSALYIFELIYRLKMRTPMIAHHFLTIIAISFTVTVFEYTQSMSYLNSAVIWLFQATTEQPTFLGLLGYRLDWNPRTVSKILKIAAVQTFIFKTASAIALVVYWGIHQNYAYRSMDKAWTAMVFILAIGLMLTQIWGSWVTYQIAIRIIKQPILSNPALKRSNLAIYQTIRLKPEDQNQSHKRSESSGSGTATNDEEGGYETMVDIPSPGRYPSTTTLNRLPSLSSLREEAKRKRLMSNSDYNIVSEKVNNGLSVNHIHNPAEIPLPQSPLLVSPSTAGSASAKSHEQHLFTAPNSPMDTHNGTRDSASFGRAL